jgi:hypothetical protein
MGLGAAHCLEFAVLTAARTGEGLGADRTTRVISVEATDD